MKIDLPERVCDVHVHVGDYFGGIDVSFPLENLLKIMKKYRIESALVFPSETNPEEETRRLMRALANNPQLYVLIRAEATNYVLPEYLKYVERQLQDNDRVLGLKVNPSQGEHYRITDNVYKRVLEILSDYGAVLLLHCGRWREMSGWHYGIEVAKQHPKIKVVLSHMGGTHPDLSFKAIEASKELSNVYLDTSQTRQIVVLERGIEKLGAERILFGSDMPWGDYLQNLLGIIALDLDESTENKILRENFSSLVKPT